MPAVGFHSGRSVLAQAQWGTGRAESGHGSQQVDPWVRCVFGRKRVPRLAHTQNALSGTISLVIISSLP